MKKTINGFTIVELLIVIVVIAILAAITTVAYNGITTRAENNKTLAAALAFYKAMKMYETDKGEVPHVGMDSCLGENYAWDFAAAASGSNQCRWASFSYYTIKGTLNNDLKPYLNNQLPAPSMQTIGDTGNWVRGLTYSAPAVGGQLVITLGQKGVTSCPSLGGQSSSSAATLANGMRCNYAVGTRLR